MSGLAESRLNDETPSRRPLKPGIVKERCMWNKTEVSKRLGITLPIIQGPFGGGLSSTRLVATVSNSGGLGSYGVHTMEPKRISQLAVEIRSLTAKPFAFNLWIPNAGERSPSAEEFERGVSLFDKYYGELGIARPAQPGSFSPDYEAQVKAVLDARPPVFSFVFGVPEKAILQECRIRGIVTIGTATTPDEAAALDDAGIDCIVASGFEAGGHRGSFLRSAEESLTGTFALVPQVVDRVKTPIIAAGGIADARGIVAAFALGAQGVQIGTAFLACEESGANAGHREKLFSDDGKHTTLTKVFTGRLARSIRNRFVDEMQPNEQRLPPYPVQRWLTGTLSASVIAPARTDFIALSAGQAAGLLRHRDANSLITELVREIPRIQERLHKL
jgi:nitronate monooxygenase